jgi:isochorismate synthase EntC
MKIIVTSTGKKKKIYHVEVVDGSISVHKESVSSIEERDELVWQLADLYNALDIEVVDEKTDEFKFTEIPSIPVLEEEEADEFFDDNSEFVFDRILQAVEEGVVAKRDSIRLFELNGTDVYITSNREDWKSGVQQALDYFASVEQYNKCIVARQLMLKL